MLGPVGVLTLDQARNLARLKLVDVLQGRDPAKDRDTGREIGTFKDLFDAYLEKHAKPHKKTWREDERRFNLHAPRRGLSRAPNEVTRDEIRRLHIELGQSAPYEANRVLALMRMIFNYGRKSGALPVDYTNPAAEITPFRERSRKRYASPDEVKAITKAIDTKPNVYIRALVWLYLLTGARKGELLPRKWSDIDRDLRRLVLTDTKAGEEQFIPISTMAMGIIDALQRVQGNPFVFPGAKNGHHIVNIGKPWRRIVKRSGVTGLRLHDLRRTVGSWMSQDGVELNTVKSALRHSDIGTTLIYARLHDDVADEALERHGERIIQIGGGFRVVAADD